LAPVCAHRKGFELTKCHVNVVFFVANKPNHGFGRRVKGLKGLKGLKWLLSASVRGLVKRPWHPIPCVLQREYSGAKCKFLHFNFNLVPSVYQYINIVPSQYL
jgi:hypothetical protein